MAATLALAATGAGLATGTANASTGTPNPTGTHIGGYTSTWCVNSPYEYCLYYHPGAAGAGWGSAALSIPTITGTFNLTQDGTDGLGVPVRNNAASLSNGSTACNVTVWVSPGYTGDWNCVSPSTGGDLTPDLRNNEASINVNNCV